MGRFPDLLHFEADPDAMVRQPGDVRDHAWPVDAVAGLGNSEPDPTGLLPSVRFFFDATSRGAMVTKPGRRLADRPRPGKPLPALDQIRFAPESLRSLEDRCRSIGDRTHPRRHPDGVQLPVRL